MNDASKTIKKDIKQILSDEFERRKQINPRYSLRAYSRFLGVESSWLSKMLRGQRPISKEMATRFLGRLGLSDEGLSDKYRFIVELDERRKHFHVGEDAFNAIQDWRHYAILELMKTKEFRPNVQWLASALALPVNEARAYVDRLVRVGLLEIHEDGSWKDVSQGFSTDILGVNKTNLAHQNSQKGILERAIHALDNVPIEKRDQASVMMATHSSYVLEAKLRIHRFLEELCYFLESAPEKDTVYQAEFSLFPLVESRPPSLDSSKKEVS